jgi:hypothetical protein
LAFDKPICENTAPTRQAAIMSEKTPRAFSKKRTAIKALANADQFWPGTAT